MSHEAPGPGRAWGGFFGRVVNIGLLLLYVLVVLGPLVALVVAAAVSPATQASRPLEPVLLSTRRVRLLLDSVALAAAVAASAVVLGGLVGSRLWSWQRGAKFRLRWLVLLLLVVPPFVHASSWMAFAGGVGALWRGVGLAGVVLPGWLCAWWVESMALVPLGVGFALVGFEAIDPGLIAAGRVFRGDAVVLGRIAVPLALPSILAGGAFVFLLSLMDYSVPYLFEVNVYPLEVYAQYSASPYPTGPLLLCLPLLAIAGVVVLLFQRGLRRAVASRPSWRTRAWRPPPRWPWWCSASQVVAGAVLGAAVLVPVLGSTAEVLRQGGGAADVSAARGELLLTLSSAALAAVCALPLAYAVADRMDRRDRWAGVWWFLAVLPLAVPAPLVGIGLVTLWNRPWLAGVYDSRLMITLAALARFAPLAAIVLLVQLRQVDPLLLDAARVFRSGALRTWSRIRLPLLAPGLLAAACVTFALALGELPATLIVAPPGGSTLTIRVYNLVHYGASGTVAALSLVVLVLALLSGVIGGLALTWWARMVSRVDGGG